MAWSRALPCLLLVAAGCAGNSGPPSGPFQAADLEYLGPTAPPQSPCHPNVIQGPPATPVRNIAIVHCDTAVLGSDCDAAVREATCRAGGTLLYGFHHEYGAGYRVAGTIAVPLGPSAPVSSAP